MGPKLWHIILLSLKNKIRKLNSKKKEIKFWITKVSVLSLTSKFSTKF